MNPFDPISDHFGPESEPEPEPPPAPFPALPRVFLRMPGWRVARKAGSDREFCHMTAPGQDYYHRLADGELYLIHGDEKLCLRCADRRGLLDFEPRRLREPMVPVVDLDEGESDYDLDAPRV